MPMHATGGFVCDMAVFTTGTLATCGEGRPGREMPEHGSPDETRGNFGADISLPDCIRASGTIAVSVNAY